MFFKSLTFDPISQINIQAVSYMYLPPPPYKSMLFMMIKLTMLIIILCFYHGSWKLLLSLFFPNQRFRDFYSQKPGRHYQEAPCLERSNIWEVPRVGGIPSSLEHFRMSSRPPFVPWGSKRFARAQVCPRGRLPWRGTGPGQKPVGALFPII